VVLDVGANIGQYARELRLHGWDKKIISFEPISEAYEVLKSRAQYDKNWHIYEKCAIGKKDGITKLQISQNLVSSSILKISETHINAAPESKVIRTESVPVQTLDRCLSNCISNADMLAIKIDVQGLELDVLNGARQILLQTKVLQVELSLAPLYNGQSDWREVIDHIVGAGFKLHAIFEGFVDDNTGTTLQIDALFVK
jgi:FkbM family methyltransferase